MLVRLTVSLSVRNFVCLCIIVGSPPPPLPHYITHLFINNIPKKEREWEERKKERERMGREKERERERQEGREE